MARHLEPVDVGDTPPDYDEPSEQALLGALLARPDAAELAVDDLYLPKHQTIAGAIAKLHANDEPTDPPAVAAALRTTGELPRIGGLPYLADLATNACTPSQAPYYARIVRDLARKRRLLEVITRAAQRLRAGTDPDDVEEAAWAALSDLIAPSERHRPGATGRHDLSHLADGSPPPVVPPPTCVQRTDGNHLFYAGRVNGIFGDPESAKTWLAQLAVIEALAAGQRAAIIDVDHNGPALTVRNLLLLGARPTHLADPALFGYYEPDGHDELLAAVDELATWSPAVAVLDSLGEMLPMMGVKSVDNDEITAALRRIANPLADAGAAVITIDHLPKGADARASGYAIGGTAKKRALDGVLLEAQVKKKPAPGQIGRITLRIHKDRPGRLREHSSGNYAGTFVLDSTNPHAIVTSIAMESAVNDQGVFRPTHLMQAVSEFVSAHPWSSWNDIQKAVTGSKKHVTQAIDVLIQEEYLTTKPGPRSSTLHAVLSLYLEAEDDQS